MAQHKNSVRMADSPTAILTSELTYPTTYHYVDNEGNDLEDSRRSNRNEQEERQGSFNNLAGIDGMDLFQPVERTGSSAAGDTASSYVAQGPDSLAVVPPPATRQWSQSNSQTASSKRIVGGPPPPSISSAFSFRTVDPYQALRDMNPFSLKGEFFHVMISHRVSSEGAEGTGLSGHLFGPDLRPPLHPTPYPLAPSLPVEPPLAFACSPLTGSRNSLCSPSSTLLSLWALASTLSRRQFARRRSVQDDDAVYYQGAKAGHRGSVTAGTKEKERPKIKVFLDEECLPEGERWKESFLLGLAHSLVFVPLLSWKSNNTGSVGQLSHLDEDSEVDHVLLELTVALELCIHGGFAVKTILPVFVGEVVKMRSTRGSNSGGEVNRVHVFKPSQIDRLPDIIPKKTNDEAALVLEALGVSLEQIEEMRMRGLRDTLRQLLDFQGIRLDADTKLSKAVTVVAKRILDTVERTLEKEQAKAFEESRPQAHEVLKWLRQKSLGGYAQAFAQHGLDSLYSVSQLTEEQIHAFFRSDSPLCTTPDHFANLGNCIRLCIAVRELRNDERAAPLAERLHLFKDRTVSSLTAMVTANGLEVVLSKPICQALILLLAACGLVGALLGVVLLARDGLPGIAGNSKPDPDLEGEEEPSEYPYLEQYSSVPNLLALTFSSLLALVAVWQSRRLSPYYAKQTIWRLLLQAFVLCLVAFALDVWQSIEFFRDHNIFRVWFVGFSFGFMLSLGTLLLTFVFFQRYLSIAFLFTVGIWSLVLGVLKLSVPDFSDVSTALPITAGGALLSGCVCLAVIIALYFLYRSGIAQIHKLAREIELTFAPTWAEIEREEGTDLDRLRQTTRTLQAKLRTEMARERSLARKIAEGLGMVPSKALRQVWDGKYRQKWDDIDVLFGHAAHINNSFNTSIQALCHETGLGTLQSGHIKHAGRAIQKTVRTYYRDPSCLTDIVRCRVLFSTVLELHTWVENLLKRSQVGFVPEDERKESFHRARKRRTSLPVNAWRDRPLQALASSDPTSAKKMYRITGLKNRFEETFDIRTTAGYRDVSFNVEVGWLSEGGSVQFLPVEAWPDAGAEVHICEVQLHITKMHVESTRTSTHNKYVKWRNLLTR